MKLKFFAVPAIDSASVEREVNQFLARHRIVRVDREMVVADGGAYWALCVGYLDSQGAAKAPVKKDKVDYKEVLAPADFTRYLELRTLRKTLAERDGVPAYNVFTNEQLAAMVQTRARSRADLAAIDGVGPSRLERFAAPFLDQLNDLWADAGDAEADTDRAG